MKGLRSGINGGQKIQRSALKKHPHTPEISSAVKAVAVAEKAAEMKKGDKVVENLKKAGKWALDISTNIGTNLVAEIIKKSMLKP